MNIETLLNWSEPKNVPTSRGPRVLRSAQATPAFWGLWRTSKVTLQDAGIAPKKDARGEWVINWWFNPEAPITALPVSSPSTPSNVAPEATQVVSEAIKTVWSDEQKAIFNWFRNGQGTNLVVEANAGTGKSTTIKFGFAEAPEESMLYAVFNKKNQIEAQEKITDPRVMIRTLNSLGFMFVKAVWPSAQPDDDVEFDRVRQVLNGVELPDDAMAAVMKLIGFAKNTLLEVTQSSLETLAVQRDIMSEETDSSYSITALCKVALGAIELSRTRDPEGRISFNDQVWLPVVMGWVTPKFDLVCIDECQDMNMLQLKMAVASCRPGGRICVVGDSRQAIYGFRGAESDGMALMKETLKAKTLTLSVTYRCPKSVVAVAQEIVPNYTAAPSAPEGTVDEICAGQIRETVQVGNAILSRLNAPLVSLCLNLLRDGKPARIEGRDIGKQLVGMVRKLKAKSVPDFLRKLDAWATKQIKRVSASGLTGQALESRFTMIRDQAGTLSAIAEGAKSVSEVESRLQNLFQDTSDKNKSNNAVVLSSVHKAKGLEWDRVFTLAATFKKSQGGEEANIYYVAVTRAKKHLTFVL